MLATFAAVMLVVAGAFLLPLAVAGVVVALLLALSWRRPRGAALGIGVFCGFWLVSQGVNADRVLVDLADPTAVAPFTVTVAMLLIPAAGVVGLIGLVRGGRRGRGPVGGRPMRHLDPATGPLPGRRLLAALVTAVSASVLLGLLTARLAQLVVPGWSADADHLAVAVVLIVYVTVAGSLVLLLGSTPSRRRVWLGLALPAGRGEVWRSTGLWAGAYVMAAGVSLLLAPLGIGPREAIDVLLAVGADNARLHDSSAVVLVLILVRVCIVVPVAEELLFRGALYGWLRQHLSAPWTIAITAVGFAAIHQAPAMLPLALLVGVAAGTIRERTGTTALPIMLHAVQNVVILVASYLATGWQATMF